MDDVTEERRVLVDVMQRASKLAHRRFLEGAQGWEKSPGQILTQTDLDVNHLIRTTLSAAFPEDGWLSEESPDTTDRMSCDRVWVIDPIDGTRSFARGRAEFSISIALVERGEVILGAVCNPCEDQMFLAVRGQGVTFGNRHLSPLEPADLSDLQIVLSGGEMQREEFRRALPDASFHRCGSVAWKLARVARGDFDATMSLRQLRDWDIAAGVLLVQEAGGQVTNRHGDRLQFNKSLPTSDGMIAGHPNVVKHVRDRLT